MYSPACCQARTVLPDNRPMRLKARLQVGISAAMPTHVRCGGHGHYYVGLH